MRKLSGFHYAFFMAALFFLFSSAPAFAAVDTFDETFDGGVDGATVDGYDSWSVLAGVGTSALTVSGNTLSGSGKSLELLGSVTPVKVGRSASYGNLTPTWVEYVIKSGLGAEPVNVPTTGIAAVCFNYTGQILASDGTGWADTGSTFAPGQWVRVMLRFDFTAHMYSIYTSLASMPKTPFVPDKDNLRFIDPSISSLSQVGFQGAYNRSQNSDSFVDEIVVYSVQRLQILTPPQTIVKASPSGPMTVQLQNASSEPQTAWQDFVLTLSSSSVSGQFSVLQNPWIPVTQLIVPRGAQQATFYYLDNTEGKPIIGVKESPDMGWQEATQAETVVGEGQFFDVSVLTPQIAGKPFEVEITAKDDQGNPNTLYNGSVDVFAKYVSPNTGTKLITPDNASQFVQGIQDVTLMYPDCGIIQIMVRDKNDALKVGASGDVTFFPASFSAVAGGAQMVSNPFSFSVSALGQDGRVTPNYQGPASLQVVPVSPAVSDGALSQSQIASGQFIGGVANLTLSYNRWGSAMIKIFDPANPAQSGLTNQINFSPKALLISVILPAGRNFFYVGEIINVSVSLVDADLLPIENFQGTVSLSSDQPLNIPSEYQFLPADQGKKIFQVKTDTPGFYTLSTVDAVDGLSAAAPPLQVIQPTIEVISTSAPVGTTQVEIHLVDEKGNTILSESQLPITITYEEEDPNNSVTFSASGTGLTFKNGVAKFVIGDTEAETVTISAETALGFKVKSGTVTFGRIGPSGVGTLMLRERKDE